MYIGLYFQAASRLPGWTSGAGALRPGCGLVPPADSIAARYRRSFSLWFLIANRSATTNREKIRSRLWQKNGNLLKHSFCSRLREWNNTACLKPDSGGGFGGSRAALRLKHFKDFPAGAAAKQESFFKTPDVHRGIHQEPALFRVCCLDGRPGHVNRRVKHAIQEKHGQHKTRAPYRHEDAIPVAHRKRTRAQRQGGEPILLTLYGRGRAEARRQLVPSAHYGKQYRSPDPCHNKGRQEPYGGVAFVQKRFHGTIMSLRYPRRDASSGLRSKALKPVLHADRY